YSAQKGEVNLDGTITLQKDDIQDYGTGSIRYDTPGTVYSIKTLARLMMQKSDNTAAYIIANHILSVDTIQSLINTWGLTQTDIINNKTSNNDMAILLEKIFHEKITNTALTQEMLSLLKDSDFEDRLPKLLPKGTNIYHKIGTEIGAVHDVGIIVSPKKSYYIGIFTSDITDEEQAADLEAKVSKAVYDFLN
ncbi:MAG TPA: serine hydrolase, partial [Patescibacteria group bacterium]|nr:serine hydrolase [Patescibacteria group bacterium]